MEADLTDRYLQSLSKKPARAGKRYDVWDSNRDPKNFGVRISDTGRRVFMVAMRLAGGKNPTRFTVGEYPSVSLADARHKARALVADLKIGITPKERKAVRERAEAQRHKNTFGAVAEEFIRRHVAKLRTRADVERSIRRDLMIPWGHRPITDITRRDLVQLLDEAIDRGSPYAAHHTFNYVHQIWEWAIARDLYGLQSSPCDRLRPAQIIGPKVARQRVLLDEEIRQIWRATERIGYPAGPLTRLLLITGQRLSEVAEASWREIDLGQDQIWTIPPERMKGGAPHEVPLSPLAIDLFSSLPKFALGDYVFTTTGGLRPVSGFSKFKARIDTTIDGGIAPWRFHDLRRTVRTRLSAFPIEDMVRELVIAHSRSGLHKVYDQHRYQAEKRKALDLWSDALRTILEPAPANVVPFSARA